MYAIEMAKSTTRDSCKTAVKKHPKIIVPQHGTMILSWAVVAPITAAAEPYSNLANNIKA